MPHAPRRRDYSAARAKRGGVKEVDAADRAVRFHALVWGVAIGIVGGPIGAAAAGLVDASPVLGFVLGLVVGVVGVPVVSLWITGGTARTIQTIHAPSGESTPYRRQYSRAEALVKRGQYGDAVALYTTFILERPHDPEPYFRLVRLHRDHLAEFEQAAAWLRRTRLEAALTPGQQLFVIHELVDLYTSKLATPARAIPELARLVEQFPGTPAAEAAARELTALRAALDRELRD